MTHVSKKSYENPDTILNIIDDKRTIENLQ